MGRLAKSAYALASACDGAGGLGYLPGFEMARNIAARRATCRVFAGQLGPPGALTRSAVFPKARHRRARRKAYAATPGGASFEISMRGFSLPREQSRRTGRGVSVVLDIANCACRKNAHTTQCAFAKRCSERPYPFITPAQPRLFAAGDRAPACPD